MKISCIPLFFAFLIIISASPVLAGYDKNYVGDMVEYDAKYEDTFVHLARDHNLGYVEIRAANPDVDPWLPGAGTDIILPKRHLFPDAPKEGIVINIPEMRLYAFVNGDLPPSTFPIGIGREGLATPLGQTKIVRKKDGPTWRPTARMRQEDPELPASVGPGPENPLGSHALYLGWPQYLIHGTNRPFGIGRRISSGCIRLYPEDISQLFGVIPTGTPVRVVDQPVKVAWIDDELFLEAHTQIDQAIEMEETGRISSPKLSDDDMDRIIKAAGVHSDRLRWPIIRKAIRERNGYPVAIARAPGYVVGRNADESNQNMQKTDAEVESVRMRAIQELEDIYQSENGDENPSPSASNVDEPKEMVDSIPYRERFSYRALNQ